MTGTTSTFLVTHVDADSAVVRDVDTAQVHTLTDPGELAVNDVLEATIAPEPPLEVAWTLEEVTAQRRIDLVDSDLEPTAHSMALVSDADVGTFEEHERAGRGAIHVFRVDPADLEQAKQDVLSDEETLARAARLEAVRVEVRTASPGVLSVRYLPDAGK